MEEGEKGCFDGDRGEAERSRVGLDETARRLFGLIYRKKRTMIAIRRSTTMIRER
jgi:hypothetical protein